MKKLISVFAVLSLLLCLTIPALAQGEYANVVAAYEGWEVNGYPDYVAVVCYADEGTSTMTVVVTTQEAVATLEELIADTSTMEILVDEQAYSYNTLLAIGEELYILMTTTDSILGFGLGWSEDETGNAVGYGTTGLECRVLLDLLESEAPLGEELTALYGDAVVITYYTAEEAEELITDDSIAALDLEGVTILVTEEEESEEASALYEEDWYTTESATQEGEAATDADEEEEEETALERITSMSPAEWCVAAVLLGFCGLSWYMMQRRQ